ncbi:lysM domain receptor-like kinase 4 [Abrus precatorius]|uniref:LysM domain receptor-like kinase 4 n=1 Tax=Abrus precatorius TaxID=3816 RepID=A0A8B8M3Y5_ABRPR|nr:lysM domain receptor-like kinase 4 [Abrus precatorius]
MRFFPFIPLFIFSLLICRFSMIMGQQPYIGLGTVACPRKGNSKSIRGYTCNGANRSCQAYLTFRSQPIYSSVSSISALLGSDPSQLAQINSVSLNDTFDINKLVIVPVNCSCAGEYYQTNTSYVFHNSETYFLVANNTFEGLTTCQALQNQNDNPANIYSGRKLAVPLRCACPTKNQTEKGIRYLLSYLVNWGDSVSLISERFGVNTDTTLEANSLAMTQSTIYPFTTLLLPLHDKPSNSQTVSPPQTTPPPSLSSSSQSSNKTWMYVVVGVVVGVFALIAILSAVILFTRYGKNKEKQGSVIVSNSFEAVEKKPQGKGTEKGNEKLSEIISGIAQSFRVYSFEELQLATDNFSPNCWIKGSVYRGVIKGDLAAIKKTEGDVSKEIEILNKVNHSNVIRLSGVCFHEGRWYLVYEYAANGSLSEWIYFSNVDGKFLNWTKRMQIALDVATGLDYLHGFTSTPHIHKDIKSSNILLDSDFRAKVANLSLARSMEGTDNEFPATRHIVGTRGYMAPEYLEHGLISTKLDVYAFGVLMLEVLTGKEVAAILTEENADLSRVLSSILGEESGQERLKEFMDPSLQANYPLELAMFVIEMIDNCIKKDPASRLDVHQIVLALSRTLDSSLSWERLMNISE